MTATRSSWSATGSASRSTPATPPRAASSGGSSLRGRICTTTTASSSSPTSAGQPGRPRTAAGPWATSWTPSPSMPPPFHGCCCPLRQPPALTATGSWPPPTSNGSPPPAAWLPPPWTATRQRRVPWPRSHTPPTTTSGSTPMADATPVPGRAGPRRQPTTHDDHDEVVDRHVADCGGEAAAVPGDRGEVGDGGAEQAAEQAEGAGGGAGERAARPAVGPGGGERAEVTGGLAADQADGHRQHAEREKDAGRGGPVAKFQERRRLGLGLDGRAGGNRDLAGGVDLRRGQGSGCLHEPAGRDRLQAELVRRVSRDEQVGAGGIGGQPAERLDLWIADAVAGMAAEASGPEAAGGDELQAGDGRKSGA